ncbi:MAG TPA: class I SAM-dependent methyltransferase [Stellaceae bacterium]|nr:class I SAM-dependent methyltransferase [Stellaceae bacterium]
MTSVAADQKLLRDYFPHCAWPAGYYGVVPALAKSLRGGSVVVEIGVAYGYHALDLLQSMPSWRYNGVDPYQAGYDDADPFSRDVAALFGETSEQRAMDRLYEAVRETLRSFGDRAVLHRQPSVDASRGFADESADLIFIDGDHRYAAVNADLAAWWPKLRRGGIFCGDDYLWPDVKKAVDEFVAAGKRQLRLVAKAGSAYPIWTVQK